MQCFIGTWSHLVPFWSHLVNVQGENMQENSPIQVSRGTVKKHHGKWYAQISYQENGETKRLYRSTGIPCYQGDFRGKQAALDFLADWRHDIVASRLGPALGAGEAEQTLTEYCEHFLSLHDVKRSTMDGYKAAVSHLSDTGLGETALSRVTDEDIAEWTKTLRESGLSRVTVGNYYRFLSMIFKRAHLRGDIERNPTLTVKAPRSTPKPVNSPTQDTAKEICAYAAARVPDCDAVGILLALMCGMRRGEVCGLRWLDVDLERGIVTVTHAIAHGPCGYRLSEPKDTAESGGKIRRIPVGSFMASVLARRRAAMAAELAGVAGGWTDAQFVCGDALTGAPLNPDMIGRRWRALVQVLDWRGTQGEPLRFHDLRHGFCTLALASGMDPVSVADIAGHRDPGFTLAVYAYPLEDVERRHMAALDRSLSPVAAAGEGPDAPAAEQPAYRRAGLEMYLGKPVAKGLYPGADWRRD